MNVTTLGINDQLSPINYIIKKSEAYAPKIEVHPDQNSSEYYTANVSNDNKHSSNQITYNEIEENLVLQYNTILAGSITGNTIDESGYVEITINCTNYFGTI